MGRAVCGDIATDVIHLWCLVPHVMYRSRECVLQLGLDRIELPETAKQPVSRKRTKSEADSPASSAQNAPSPVGGPPAAQVGMLCPISGGLLGLLSVRIGFSSSFMEGPGAQRSCCWRAAWTPGGSPLHRSALMDLGSTLPSPGVVHIGMWRHIQSLL